jgi:membrane-associated protease RseP (regulator of RpoE activity)
MILGIVILFNAALLVYSGMIDQPAFQFVLPTPSAVGTAGPGYILIPFWFWVIVIAVVLIPHELLHGVIARAQKIKLKSVGLMLLAFIPGAFVEPDEKQIQKSKTMKKLRIFSAGSFANFMIAFFVFFLTLYFLWPAITDPGITLYNVTDGSPADIAGLKPNMTLTEVNGTQLMTHYCGLLDYLSGRICGSFYVTGFGNPQPSDVIQVKADGELYNVKLELNEETNTTYMGVTYMPVSNKDLSYFAFIIPLLTMISLFSFGIGLVNILPIYPLDGGQMVKAISDKFFKKNSMKIVRIITYIVLFVMIYDFVGPFL